MRVLLDTNLFISYLLTPPDRSGTIGRIVEAGFGGEFTLLLPEEVPRELGESIVAKPFLRDRIAADDLLAFIALLREVAELLPPIEEPYPAVTRDPDDDYLLAHALLAGADYLVSGDKDLLSLSPIEGLTILSPTDFAKLL